MATLDFEHKTNRTLDAVEGNPDIHPDNKDAILRFIRDIDLEGLSKAWQQKLSAHLKVVAEHVGPDTSFRDMDTEDVKNLVAWLQSRDTSDATVRSYKQVLKRFWKWLKPQDDEKKHPEEVAWINTSSRKNSKKLPKDLLTPEDVDLLIEKGARNPRDKALIALLWETGARIGELIDLTVGDIEDREHGKKVVVDGKTGSRRIPLRESVPYLNQWLNQHPDPDRENPLWTKIQQGTGQLGYNYIRLKILQKAAERADLDKPVNPHHFRHSRASFLANRFTEAQLCEWFGWVQGSDVPAKYVHLSGRDIDKAFNKMHGIEEQDEDDMENRTQECPRCKEINSPGASFCSNCGQAFDLEAAEKLEENEEKLAREADQEKLDRALDVLGVEDEARREALKTLMEGVGS